LTILRDNGAAARLRRAVARTADTHVCVAEVVMRQAQALWRCTILVFFAPARGPTPLSAPCPCRSVSHPSAACGGVAVCPSPASHPPSSSQVRMYGGGKGISGSALPFKRTAPTWLKTPKDDVVDQG